MLEALITEPEAVEDPRDPRRVEHRLVDILVVAACAVPGQAESSEDVADYGRRERERPGRFPAPPNGVPSHDTFRRAFTLVDPDAFERVLPGRVRPAFAPDGTGPDRPRQVAARGKVPRHSCGRGEGWRPPRLVS